MPLNSLLIRERRQSLGLTQSDVAASLGLHVNAYARLERGDRATTVRRLEALAAILKLPPAKLLK